MHNINDEVCPKQLSGGMAIIYVKNGYDALACGGQTYLQVVS